MRRSIRRESVRLMAMAAVALATTLTLAACDGYDVTGPSVAAGAYKGTFVGTTASGVLTITFPTADATAVTGVLVVTSGATVNLTGTYDATDNPQLTLTGGAYTFVGIYNSIGFFYDKSSLSGTYTGPGTDIGRWTVGSGVVKVFCGGYSGTATGTWNLVLDGLDQITGVARVTGGTIRLAGTYNPTTGQIAVSSLDDAAIAASGSLNATTGAGSGNWTTNGAAGGSWAANTTGC